MLAVTTRNELHSWRFCPPMLWARRRIRQQLAVTPGLIRYVPAIASPTEFLTLTVWESRRAMFDFMSSDAHRTFMWMFARWSASFWSMRWLPTTAEQGTWEGLSLASLVEPGDQSWRRPQPPLLPLNEQPPGRAPGAHFADSGRSGVYATTALVETASPGRLWALLRAVWELYRDADGPQILRWSVGAVDSRRFLVLTLWRDVPGGGEGAEGYADVARALCRRLSATWTMCWAAGEYEIGHWNGLRLRQLAAARARTERMGIATIDHTASDTVRR
jgi:hypothetical protein